MEDAKKLYRVGFYLSESRSDYDFVVQEYPVTKITNKKIFYVKLDEKDGLPLTNLQISKDKLSIIEDLTWREDWTYVRMRSYTLNKNDIEKIKLSIIQEAFQKTDTIFNKSKNIREMLGEINKKLVKQGAL